MYLSRLILNPRSRAVRGDLANCQVLHRTVMSAFPDLPDAEARARLGVLYRLDADPRTGRITLLVQSREAPDWSRLAPDYLLETGGEPPNPACKPLADSYEAIQMGQSLRFRLRANPTRRLARVGPGDRGRVGQRVDLRSEEDQIVWLRRKGEQGGFEVLDVKTDRPTVDGLATANVRTVDEPKVVGRRRTAEAAGGSALTFGSVLFDGLLRVADAERFRLTLHQGIGSGKAYGFGLLSIAPT
jgi:CRISPR system Cascade subunit CasE